MILTFSFSMDDKTNEVVCSGNIPLKRAVEVILDIYVSETAKQAVEAEKKRWKDTE